MFQSDPQLGHPEIICRGSSLDEARSVKNSNISHHYNWQPVGRLLTAPADAADCPFPLPCAGSADCVASGPLSLADAYTAPVGCSSCPCYCPEHVAPSDKIVINKLLQHARLLNNVRFLNASQ